MCRIIDLDRYRKSKEITGVDGNAGNHPGGRLPGETPDVSGDHDDCPDFGSIWDLEP
ncbi:MAG: hypothetical protein PHT96_12640 [Syntrophorhabdaceae bacterium]|nr:hypothetical protein [Syntrophorhabdaceae bacterium]MDD4197235.1 hypothetical protein [Syntrophorhabdaceae bacterium]